MDFADALRRAMESGTILIRLVVSAEDYGSSAEADALILRGHREGVVTSVSLVGNAVEFDGALAGLRGATAIGVGVALALVGGTPVAPAAAVPTLVRADGRLRGRGAEFALDWFKGAIAAADVERELEAQIARVRDAGLTVGHLCTAHSLGFVPGVGAVVERLARRFAIPGVRASVEPPGLGWVAEPRRGLETAVLSGMAWLTRRRMGPLRHGPVTWGYVESDRLDEVRILEIIGRLAPGAHELLCHPGGPGGAGELAALASAKVRTALAARGIVLCRWQDLF
jgi:predicted glycoside hydrolase/deacetylase ChbG (UPF0249 family)